MEDSRRKRVRMTEPTQNTTEPEEEVKVPTRGWFHFKVDPSMLSVDRTGLRDQWRFTLDKVGIYLQDIFPPYNKKKFPHVEIRFQVSGGKFSHEEEYFVLDLEPWVAKKLWSGLLEAIKTIEKQEKEIDLQAK